jgi:hypothetical protein
MALIESLSSWAPQPYAQSAPPSAHAPNPARVMFIPVVPSGRVDHVISALLAHRHAGRRGRCRASVTPATNLLRLVLSAQLRATAFTTRHNGATTDLG